MRKVSTLALALAFLAGSAPAFAATVWGTIDSVTGNMLMVSIDKGDKDVPRQLSAKLADDAKFKGSSQSAADLKTGDKVKLNVKEDNGQWTAKSIEKIGESEAAAASASLNAPTNDQAPAMASTDASTASASQASANQGATAPESASASSNQPADASTANQNASSASGSY